MIALLWIFGIAAVLGVIYAAVNRESVAGGALAGMFVAGNCLVQLLVPVALLFIGLFVWRLIFH